MPLKSLAFAIVALLGTGAVADPVAAPLTYEQFEVAVPHMDLEACPQSLAQPETFCRATLQHEEIHVFVFSETNDSPMVGFASFSADKLGSLLN